LILKCSAIHYLSKIKTLLQNLNVFKVDHETMFKEKYKVARYVQITCNKGIIVLRKLIEIVIDDCNKCSGEAS